MINNSGIKTMGFKSLIGVLMLSMVFLLTGCNNASEDAVITDKYYKEYSEDISKGVKKDGRLYYFVLETEDSTYTVELRDKEEYDKYDKGQSVDFVSEDIVHGGYIIKEKVDD